MIDFSVELTISGEMLEDKNIAKALEELRLHTQRWIDTYDDSIPGHVEKFNVHISTERRAEHWKLPELNP